MQRFIWFALADSLDAPHQVAMVLTRRACVDLDVADARLDRLHLVFALVTVEERGVSPNSGGVHAHPLPRRDQPHVVAATHRVVHVRDLACEERACRAAVKRGRARTEGVRRGREETEGGGEKRARPRWRSRRSRPSGSGASPSPAAPAARRRPSAAGGGGDHHHE